MKILRIFILFAIAAPVVVSSCKKEYTASLPVTVLPPVEEEAPDPLVDSWNYIISSGGWTGNDESSEFAAGEWIEFTSNGLHRHYDADSILQRERPFIIAIGQSMIFGDQRSIIRYDSLNSFDRQSYDIIGDTLILRDEASDAFRFKFARRH